MVIRAIALVLLICGQTVAQDRRSYIIGPGDEISIHVLDSTDFPDKPLKVDPDGQIALPLIGRIQAAGKSVSEIETDLTDKLRTYILSPQVSVNITDFGSQPVTVLGEVVAPGVYQLSGAKPLAQVIAMAKGLAPDAGGKITVASHAREMSAAKGAFRVSFNSADAPEVGDPVVTEVAVADLLSSSGTAAATIIHPYDVITVSKSRLIYVIGEVHKAGGFALGNRQSVSVLEAISMAEGTLPSALPQHAKLLRREANSEQRVETPIDLKSILAGKGDNMLLYPDDVLIIPKNALRAVALRSIEAAIALGTGIAIWGRF